MATDKELKTKILNSIKKVRASGYTLVCEDWGNVKNKCACAMGCVLIDNGCEEIDDACENFRIVSDMLDVSEVWVDAFIEGYDGCGIAQGTSYKAITKHKACPCCGKDGLKDLKLEIYTCKPCRVVFEEAWMMGQAVAKETKPITFSEFRNGKR